MGMWRRDQTAKRRKAAVAKRRILRARPACRQRGGVSGPVAGMRSSSSSLPMVDGEVEMRRVSYAERGYRSARSVDNAVWS